MLVLFWAPWECNGHCNESLHLTPDVTIVRVLKMLWLLGMTKCGSFVRSNIDISVEVGEEMKGM
jgi:hypothetical protein